jgi:hypothetical protein
MSVYKLICNETGKVYYGSTKNTLEVRKQYGWKKCSCKDFVNPNMELVETVDDLNNLLEREDYYIRNFECVNKHRVMITDEEKDAYKREYYLKNIDKFNEQQRQYYLKVKDVKIAKQKKYRENNLEKRRAIEKKYYLKNSDKIKERQREYYLKNRDKILAKQRENRLKKQENS